MDGKKNITITIINKSRPIRAFQQGGMFVISVVAPIALGAVLQSSAMQWAGFIFGMMFLLTMGINIIKKTSFTTVEEAKAHLDELKASGEAA